MTIFELADTLTGLTEAVTMLIICDALLLRIKNIPSWVYLVSTVIVAALVNISNIVLKYSYANIVVMMLLFFAMSFLYKGKITTKTVVSVLNYLISLIAELMVMYSIIFVYDITTFDAVNNQTYRLLGIILSKMLALLAVNALRIRFKQKKLSASASYWLLYILMFLSSTTLLFLIFKISYAVEETYLYKVSMLCACGVVLSTFFTLFLYERSARQAETIQNQEQYERHLRMQLKHIDDILITQKQFKRFKHDFNNFRIGLKAYIKENDFKGAESYIDELEGKIVLDETVVETGNTALDAILSTKLAIAKSKGIEVKSKIQIPEKIAVEPTDLCIIFGNALDNAIEACERVEAGEKKISITILCKDEAVLCKIVNSMPKEEKAVLDTQKEDKSNHGFGLENIRAALIKYNAEPTIEQTDGKFTLKFVIFT